MKKYICLALALALLFLGGCGGSVAPTDVPETDFTPAVTASPTPSPSPTPTPTPTPDPVETRAREILAEMTQEEKVWQLFVLRAESMGGDGGAVTEASQLTAPLPVGGVCLSAGNIVSKEQLSGLISDMQSQWDIPLLVAVDEEGGTVARVGPALGTTVLDAMYSYRDQGTQTAYDNARALAADISALGFNVDFAPVADVWTNPANTVIGGRAYSDDPQEAAELVAAAVEGFHDGGVAATLKHFPGHGDTAEDSHNGAAYSHKTLEELESCELLPFISGIQAGADLVMTGHITLTEIDPDHPATLSYDVVTGLLREELGYQGVVITDAMEMGAIVDTYGADAAVMALEAGCDLILTPADPSASAQAVLEQVSPERIDESVLRVLMLKIRLGIL